MKDTFKSYGRIDIFRPYFDVEPSQVLRTINDIIFGENPLNSVMA